MHPPHKKKEKKKEKKKQEVGFFTSFAIAEIADLCFNNIQIPSNHNQQLSSRVPLKESIQFHHQLQHQIYPPL